jgi:hypothetical protein
MAARRYCPGRIERLDSRECGGQLCSIRTEGPHAPSAAVAGPPPAKPPHPAHMYAVSSATGGKVILGTDGGQGGEERSRAKDESQQC